MRVGLSLLTLSPGDMGGSETYARQLIRSLAQVGTADYAVLVPARMIRRVLERTVTTPLVVPKRRPRALSARPPREALSGGAMFA